jgi:hypothetical protein
MSGTWVGVAVFLLAAGIIAVGGWRQRGGDQSTLEQMGLAGFGGFVLFLVVTVFGVVCFPISLYLGARALPLGVLLPIVVIGLTCLSVRGFLAVMSQSGDRHKQRRVPREKPLAGVQVARERD